MRLSKSTVSTAAALVIIAALAGLYIYSSSIPTINNGPSCHDPDSINSHIYNPGRLVVQKSCITVSGTVDKVISEDDGDYHLRLRLDPAYGNLTNGANDQYQYGDLVVEIICAHAVTQQDAIAACENYVNSIPVPQEGSHITVSGPYVLDSGHYYWAEIHPVYSLTMS